jgi:hypothetical protein
MAARRKTEDEAAWVAVARLHLPGHLTWVGFCRLMGWRDAAPTNMRTGDDHFLSFYVRAAEHLELPVPVLVEKVLDEMTVRKAPRMEQV